MTGNRPAALVFLACLAALAGAVLFRLAVPPVRTFYDEAAKSAPGDAVVFFAVDDTRLSFPPARVLTEGMPSWARDAHRVAGWWEDYPVELETGVFLVNPSREAGNPGKERGSKISSQDGWHWAATGRNVFLSRQRARLETTLDQAGDTFWDTGKLAALQEVGSPGELVVYAEVAPPGSAPSPMLVGARRLLALGAPVERAWVVDWILELESGSPLLTQGCEIPADTVELVPASVDHYGAVHVDLLRRLFPNRLGRLSEQLARRDIELEGEVMPRLSGEMAFVQSLGPEHPPPALIILSVSEPGAVQDLIQRAFPRPIRTSLLQQFHGTTLIRSFGKQLAFAVTERFLLVALNSDGSALRRVLETPEGETLAATVGYKLLRQRLGESRPLMLTSWSLGAFRQMTPEGWRFPGEIPAGARLWQAATRAPTGLRGVVVLSLPKD